MGFKYFLRRPLRLYWLYAKMDANRYLHDRFLVVPFFA